MKHSLHPPYFSHSKNGPRKWNGRLVDRMSGQKAGNIKRLDVAVATPLRLVQMLKENRSLGAPQGLT